VVDAAFPWAFCCSHDADDFREILRAIGGIYREAVEEFEERNRRDSEEWRHKREEQLRLTEEKRQETRRRGGRSPKRALREAVFSRDDWQCVKCGSTKRLVPDHVVPWVKGGDTTLDNLRTLCEPCNAALGANGP
jgi:5-methylcytosine-specific restriction endonuclease McrA